MTRSRLVVFGSMLVVGVGVVAGLGAVYLDPARAAVGPLEAEALALPADSRFVIGLDVKRFVASPFFARFADKEGQARPDAFEELEEKLGLNPERDLDRIVIAGRDPAGMKTDPGHRADHRAASTATSSAALAEEKPGVTTKNHQGTSMYLYNEEKKGATAVAFLDDAHAGPGLAGRRGAVIENRAKGSGGLRSNTALVALIETVKPGSTFWLAGDQTLLARMPATLPGRRRHRDADPEPALDGRSPATSTPWWPCRSRARRRTPPPPRTWRTSSAAWWPCCRCRPSRSRSSGSSPRRSA